jgi:hypothetical protein
LQSASKTLRERRPWQELLLCSSPRRCSMGTDGRCLIRESLPSRYRRVFLARLAVLPLEALAQVLGDWLASSRAAGRMEKPKQPNGTSNAARSGEVKQLEPVPYAAGNKGRHMHCLETRLFLEDFFIIFPADFCRDFKRLATTLTLAKRTQKCFSSN